MDENTHTDVNTRETKMAKIRQEAQGRYDIARWQRAADALSAPQGQL